MSEYTVLAVFQVIRRKRLLAEFRAERGEGGKGVAEWHTQKGGLRRAGYTGMSAHNTDAEIVEKARVVAETFVRVYAPTGKVSILGLPQKVISVGLPGNNAETSYDRPISASYDRPISATSSPGGRP